MSMLTMKLLYYRGCWTEAARALDSSCQVVDITLRNLPTMVLSNFCKIYMYASIVVYYSSVLPII